MVSNDSSDKYISSLNLEDVEVERERFVSLKHCKLEGKTKMVVFQLMTALYHHHSAENMGKW